MIGRLIGNKVFWLISAGGLAIVLYLAFGYFQIQAAFIDREVNESFAASPKTVEETTRQQTQLETIEETTREGERTEPAVAETTQEAAPQPAPQSEPEPQPEPEPSGPEQVSAGTFHDVEYEGTGDAIVYRQEDGSHVLRLENLDVDNGPDLFVYAVAADDAFDAQTVLDAGFVDLGPLKGNQGNQTYALPPEFDPEIHRAVSIWCQQFTANFVTAPLGSV